MKVLYDVRHAFGDLFNKELHLNINRTMKDNDFDPIPFADKVDAIQTGKTVLAVNAKVFADPQLLERGDNIYCSQRVFDRTFINWPNKMSTSPPGPTTTGYDFINHKNFTGINFATQDYMSLCYNQGSINAAVEALKVYGSHSGGSPLFFGKHPYYFDVIDSLKRAFGQVFPNPSPSIFSTGWMAGYGVLSSLSTKNDYIVMDELCHNCLQHGAKSSGAKVIKVEHLNNDAMCDKIVELRKSNAKCGIIVCTEGLFSMDSDSPDLARIQQTAEANNAVFVVDCAHDMFCLGEKGLGNPGEKIKKWDNVVLLGSGSKSLANNFGWCVSNKTSLPNYMNYYAGTMTFSNAIAPAAAANVRYNIDLLMGEDGKARRKRSMENILYIRKRLAEAGFDVIGDPSPIVIILIGSEFVSRSISNMLYEDGVVVNCVEFPACNVGESRLRLQVQCDHTREHLDAFVDKLIAVMPRVEAYLATDELAKIVTDKIMETLSKQAL